MTELDPNHGPSAFELLGLGQPETVPDTHVAPLSRRQLREAEARASHGAPMPSASTIAPPAAPLVLPPLPPTERPRPHGAGSTAQKTPEPKRTGSKLLTLGAMTFAAALIVGLSVPASVFTPQAVAQTDTSGSAALTKGQTVAVSDVASAADTTRTDFTVTSYQDLLKLRYGNRDFAYTVGIGPVQWPFPYPVPISSGFGARVAPCRGCSTFHKGLDFTPGEGTPIHAIADGVVTTVESGHFGYGNMVIIDHVINGVKVQSVYGHMLDNSVAVHVGETVKVGDLVGQVGSTGESTGPHLHFEIRLDGVQIDPFAWLKANAAS